LRFRLASSFLGGFCLLRIVSVKFHSLGVVDQLAQLEFNVVLVGVLLHVTLLKHLSLSFLSPRF
jgi:hypothetical protein